MEKPVIGFIGLGLMGCPMVKNLLNAGFTVYIYDRSAKRQHEVEALGGKGMTSPKELAEHAELIITMVPAGEHVRSALFEPNGVVQALRKPRLIIDMSTIGPTAAKSIGDDLKKNGIAFMDAPVTGTVPKAENATLTIFVGASEADYEYALPVLQAFGTAIHFMGPYGTGQSMKIVNNYIITMSVIGLAEAMVLAERMGLDRQHVGEVLSHVPCMSEHMKFKIPNFMSDTYPLFFSVQNKVKDLNLTALEAEKGKTKLESLTYMSNLYQRAVDAGLEGEDMSIIFKILKEDQE